MAPKAYGNWTFLFGILQTISSEQVVEHWESVPQEMSEKHWDLLELVVLIHKDWDWHPYLYSKKLHHPINKKGGNYLKILN